MKYIIVLLSLFLATSLQAQPEELVVQPDSTLFFGHTVEIADDHTMIWKSIPNLNTILIMKRVGETWIEIDELDAPQGDALQGFGTSIDMNEDRAIIGGPAFDYSTAVDAGITYIFERSGDVWTSVASQTPNDIQGHDNFGWSVGLDGNLAVIGSPREDERGADAGSAYIFRNSGADWVQEAKIGPTDGLGMGMFGNAVAISGDYVIAGAPTELDGFSLVGSAYIFERVDTSWVQAARLVPIDPTIVESFGSSVEIHGDMAMVGAIGSNGTVAAAGGVYIYQRIDSVWTFLQKIVAGDGGSSDEFGKSIAFESGCAVIGASGTGQSIGKAYFFEYNGFTWEEAGFIGAQNGGVGNSYGYDVALSNGNVVVGSLTTPGTSDAAFGATYLYNNACAAFISTHTEKNPLPTRNFEALLASNYPNPFSHETTISFEVKTPATVALEVFNALGQRVTTIASGTHSVGTYQVTWNRRSDDGSRLANGIYFYALRMDGRLKISRPMIVR